MEEKHRSPPINPLLLRIRTSIASLRSTSNYNLLPLTIVSPNTSPIPPTTFRHGRWRTILFPPHFVRRKWGYLSFMLLVIFIIIIRLQLSKRNHVPFEETPAVTGHTKESQQQQTKPLPPIFSTFTDNYPKQLAILILTSSSTSLDTFSKTIIDTWGKIAKQNKSLSVDLWFATPEDTFKKFGWPNIPYNDDEINKVDKEGFENIVNNNDVTEDVSINDNKKGLEKELKDLLKEILQETMIFKEQNQLSDEQKEFQKLTKALHYLYENHLDHYNYILKITDKTFVRLPKLIELLSTLNNTENNFLPKLIGSPNLDHETTKKFCFKGSGYIINKNLLTMIGPHLPYCLATIIKNSNIKNNYLQEDLAIERCFTKYVPMFKGCETFVDSDNNNDGLKKLRGYEFLNLRSDDEINWEKYKKPLEMFNDGYTNGWRFADAIVMGEVKDPSRIINLEEWYGKDGKFNELVEELGGVIPDPEPIPLPKQSDLLTIETIMPTETSNENINDVQSQGSDNIETSNVDVNDGIPTEASNAIVNDGIISEKSIVPIEKSPSETKNIINETNSISKMSISTTSEEKISSQSKINNENDGDYDDATLDVLDNHNGNGEVEVDELSPLSGEELAEP
ncbi:hypothetical protein RhiirA5_350949 [Rhizophagus irregularis]|uniref:Glycosyltransferase family 31 protein n=3 Tax=Rhizophagus irregularis TaxID=588596 RepID=U9UGL9_RHIID|nr:glycosyltransferase family 31 protein [Rhizophagus irregularis DAOM 181602=DAOM 197198]PKC13991.1 hypothetical protein RhiirA5_350949 [Rhizophagus irregularis]PKY12823.1 hypothetical protein RhiirB3_398001 [Rhizophagus irregularis]POG70298.1 glycosyltransferase family 31 protein [Rhizophagus irregularis DAOM 181602=DAOM 197198]UZO25856.1 hypothetical protein OCT59_018113 [Rhizophagus irregularis]CAB4476077.1 unnamed protein product [Rhizophagus irregularis]|eukprot:XP_025177164.1 glycosyltransferase family 31 protein [Rhizophagus irregularis DAOM 181602=DAOM 197198]